MSPTRALNIAMLMFVPTVGMTQSLKVDLYWDSADVQALADVSCPAGSEGFTITMPMARASLEASSEFIVANTSHLRVRKGTALETGKKHFRPAYRSIESTRTVLSMSGGQGRLVNEGQEAIEAEASISLIGCRTESEIDVLEGHLTITGKAAAYSIQIDTSLQSLMAASGGIEAVGTNFRVPSMTASSEDLGHDLFNGLAKIAHRMEQNRMRNVDDSIGVLAFGLTAKDWSFPSVHAGAKPLTATLELSGSTVLRRTNDKATSTN